MKEYIKIAWRNLWRNRKRTAITVASILFAVFFAILMRSMELGSYDNMIKNAIERYSGFIQVQNIEYEDDRGVDNSINASSEILEKLDKIEGIKAAAPRVESFAFASLGTQTKGVLVCGVDLEREKNLANPNNFLVKYRFTDKNIKELTENQKLPKELKEQFKNLRNNSYSNLAGLELDLNLDKKQKKQYLPVIEKAIEFKSAELSQDDREVLVSDRLAKFLKLNIGDTLVLMGQGYHASSAADLFPVKGIVKLPSPELDNKLVYMSLSRAQEFYGLENQASYIAINLDDNNDNNLHSKQNEIYKSLNDKNVVVKNWKEFNKVLFQQIESDSQSGIVMLGLLYFIILFGIFGTVLMMIHERYREFGVLVSIGMQRAKLSIVLVIEMIFIGFMGVISGILLSLPFLYMGNRFPIRLTGEMATMMESYGMEPIMPLAWIDSYVFWQGAVVALMVVLSCIYPLRKVLKLKEVEALRA
jgi:ABC-type lipoprotein release transport system permease subunit